MLETKKISICRAFLQGLAFFTVGMCTAIVGPTLPDLQSQTSASSIASTIGMVVSVNAFGCLLGLLIGQQLSKFINTFVLLAFLLLLCSLTTMVIPWCPTSSAASLVFLFQGLTLGLIIQGLLLQFYVHWKHRYQLLYGFFLVMSLGSLFSPLVTSAFVFTKFENVSAALTVNSTMNDIQTLNDSTLIQIHKRNTEIEIDNLSLSNSSDFVGNNSTIIMDPIVLVTNQSTVVIALSVNTKLTTIRSDVKTSSTIANSSATVAQTQPPVTDPSNGNLTVWDNVLQIVKQFNNVRVAYLTVGLITLISASAYGFVCCCVPCREMRTLPTENSDYPFKFKMAFASKVNFYGVASSTLLAFLLCSFESVVSTGLTYYCIASLGQVQSSGVLLSVIFWLSVCASHLVVLLFNKKLWNFGAITLTMGAAVLSCTSLAVFSSSWTIVWVSILLLGLTVGQFNPMTICWSSQQLGLGPWFGVTWFASAQLGRMTFPFLTVQLMSLQKPIIFPLVLLVLVISLSVAVVAFKSAVNEASHMTVVDKLAMTSNDEIFAYRRHVDEEDGLELDALDELTHFDRNNIVQYFVKK